MVLASFLAASPVKAEDAKEKQENETELRIKLANYSTDKNLQYALAAKKLGTLLRKKYRFKEAESLLKEALSIDSAKLGKTDAETLDVSDNLAALYCKAEKFEDAEKLLQEMIEIQKSKGTERDLKLLDYQDALAQTFCQHGHYSEAEKLYVTVLLKKIEILGNEHKETAFTKSGLALVYRHTRKHIQAEILFKQALDTLTKLLDEKDPDIAIAKSNYGLFLMNSMGRFEEAEPLLKDALEIRKEKLGTKHEDYATSINSLATLYRNQKKFRQAEKLYFEAIEIKKETVGNNNSNYTVSLNNLATLYREGRRYSDAELLFLTALQINRKVLGELHPDTASAYSSLGYLYLDQNRSEEAEPYFKIAWLLRSKIFGDSNPATRQSAYMFFKTCMKNFLEE